MYLATDVFFYCSVDSLPLTNTLTLFAAAFLFGTVFLEVWAMVLLYKRWTALKAQGGTLQGSLDLSMPIRIFGFGFYITIALSLSLLSIKAPESPAPDLIIASAATVLLAIFGTQRDIISVLDFRRNGRTTSRGTSIDESKEQTMYETEHVNPPSRSPSWPRFSAI